MEKQKLTRLSFWPNFVAVVSVIVISNFSEQWKSPLWYLLWLLVISDFLDLPGSIWFIYIFLGDDDGDDGGDTLRENLYNPKYVPDNVLIT